MSAVFFLLNHFQLQQIKKSSILFWCICKQPVSKLSTLLYNLTLAAFVLLTKWLLSKFLFQLKLTIFLFWWFFKNQKSFGMPWVTRNYINFCKIFRWMIIFNLYQRLHFCVYSSVLCWCSVFVSVKWFYSESNIFIRLKLT